jgi:hypothetical protein
VTRETLEETKGSIGMVALLSKKNPPHNIYSKLCRFEISLKVPTKVLFGLCFIANPLLSDLPNVEKALYIFGVIFEIAQCLDITCGDVYTNVTRREREPLWLIMNNVAHAALAAPA